MPEKWTREEIVRQILQRDAAGLPLTLGGTTGVDQPLYQAAARVFGSWRNAVISTGIPSDRAGRNDRWPPAKIFIIIRNLARRRRPMSVVQLERRYGSMVAAARRLFGSWTKAVVAAGVDPTKFQRVVPWTRELVLEAILKRALRNDPLTLRHTQPRSLVEAGRRFFGCWSAALAAAGLDPKSCGSSPDTLSPIARQAPARQTRRQPWTKELVVTAIARRLAERQPMNSQSIYHQDRSLLSAAVRRFGNWSNALRAAGLDPRDYRRHGEPVRRQATVPDAGDPVQQSQPSEAVRPDLR
jgi:hypothetical protein